MVVRALHELLVSASYFGSDISSTLVTLMWTSKRAMQSRMPLYMPFLVHPQVHAPSCLVTDTSEVDVGDVLQSCMNSLWSLLAYFSCKLTPTVTSYSTVDSELLEVYLAFKHFWHYMEGWEFFVVMNHKPLTFTLAQAPLYQLDVMTYICYLKGSSNAAPNVLSCVEFDAIHTGMECPRLITSPCSWMLSLPTLCQYMSVGKELCEHKQRGWVSLSLVVGREWYQCSPIQWCMASLRYDQWSWSTHTMLIF